MTNPIMTMRERVARAIFAAWAQHQRVDYTFDEVRKGAATAGRFPALHDTYDLAFLEADAAIAAMRDPTPLMIERGHAKAFAGAEAPECYRDMIDAARSEEVP